MEIITFVVIPLMFSGPDSLNSVVEIMEFFQRQLALNTVKVVLDTEKPYRNNQYLSVYIEHLIPGVSN